MAPTNSKSSIGAAPQKPAVLGPIAKAKRVLPKHSHAQRSSLRRAIQESLRDVPAVAAPEGPPASTASTNTKRHGSQRTSKSNLAGSGSPNEISDNGWHLIRSIIAEARNPDGRFSYLVEWEGHDPRTGVNWPSSWVDAKNVSKAAKREWAELQAAKAETR
ncbi:hypothetical protein F5Y05DRAFT_407092 [Hypoxylon sp. FL0543]|nr:hypothetical protein F5Y05DRAFT_407092 [Hypoxylon sp. FL0543]